MKPPIAKKIPHTLSIHNDDRIDDYFWMNERDSEPVLSYLKAENEYYHHVTKDTKKLEINLFKEMKSRIKEDDSSVPFYHNGYWYQTRFETGKDYPIYTRRKQTIEAKEEIIIDCNELAKGHSYFNMSELEISPDNKLLAYCIDTVGRRIYDIHFKKLNTDEAFDYQINKVSGGIVWANDNKSLFYVTQDEETLRPNKIHLHTIQQPKNDKLIYTEQDDTFHVNTGKSKTEKYITITSGSTMTSECYLIPTDNLNTEPIVFSPRERKLEYMIGHHENKFYILTNKDGATNFKIMKTDEQNTHQKYWKEYIPHREDVLIEDIEIFKNYLIINERSNGLNQLRVICIDDSQEYYIPFDSETYTVSTISNHNYDTDTLRFAYNSMTTPSSVIEYHLKDKTQTVLKETKVLNSDFDKNNYTSKRIWATARDGEKVGISLVYKNTTSLDGSAPLLLYGYGSYGYTIDAYFSSNRLTLLDRGFIFAIAHIRGGEYLGRQWYENGKILNKKNTFFDFIDCTEHLIKQKYTSPEHCYAMGGSAGGLLMGAIVNMAPELYHGVVASVPFVDVVTTMLDDSIPLTTGEYDEWGNPNEIEYYNYIKSYSPYDNVCPQKYPNMLIITGYHDSQVQYWEPAKWVAKLRKQKKDDNILLFHTNMNAGHSGASGRFESLKEIAQEYSFLLKLEDIFE